MHCEHWLFSVLILAAVFPLIPVADAALLGKLRGNGKPEWLRTSRWPIYDPATRIGMEIGDERRPGVILDSDIVDFYDDRAER